MNIKRGFLTLCILALCLSVTGIGNGSAVIAAQSATPVVNTPPTVTTVTSPIPTATAAALAPTATAETTVAPTAAATASPTVEPQADEPLTSMSSIQFTGRLGEVTNVANVATAYPGSRVTYTITVPWVPGNYADYKPVIQVMNVLPAQISPVSWACVSKVNFACNTVNSSATSVSASVVNPAIDGTLTIAITGTVASNAVPGIVTDSVCANLNFASAKGDQLARSGRSGFMQMDSGCATANVTIGTAPAPTAVPTKAPTLVPTNTPVPTIAPTQTPVPTIAPTKTPVPTIVPTKAATIAPITPVATTAPVKTPVPTVAPTKVATTVPTIVPTIAPTQAATIAPVTPVATEVPTNTPMPTLAPTNTPVPTIVPVTPASTEVPVTPETPQTKGSIGQITTTASQATVKPGEHISYTISMPWTAGTTADYAADVQVTVIFASYVDPASVTWTCTTQDNMTCNQPTFAAASNSLMTASVIDVSRDGALSITVSGTVAADAQPGTLTSETCVNVDITGNETDFGAFAAWGLGGFVETASNCSITNVTVASLVENQVPTETPASTTEPTEDPATTPEATATETTSTTASPVATVPTTSDPAVTNLPITGTGSGPDTDLPRGTILALAFSSLLAAIGSLAAVRERRLND